MVKGIGCDIVEHAMTSRLDWLGDSLSLARILSKREQVLYEESCNKIAFVSGRFAAKEAILKCLGTGMLDGLSLTEIEIVYCGLGKPCVELSESIQHMCCEQKIVSWHVTISHTNDYSLAVAVAEGPDSIP